MVIGNDEPGRSLLDGLSLMNMDREGIIVVDGRSTTTKTRIIAGDDHTSKQQMIRIDREVAAQFALRHLHASLHVTTFDIRKTPLSLRFHAAKVTLSKFAGGEYSRRSLLTLDGYPTSPADYAQGGRSSPRTQETPLDIPLNISLPFC